MWSSGFARVSAVTHYGMSVKKSMAMLLSTPFMMIADLK